MKEYWKKMGEDGTHGFSQFKQRDKKTYDTFFLDILGLVNKEDRILEIGCNVCGNLNYLYEKDYKNLYGVDIGYQAIEFAKNEYPNLKKRIFADDAINFLRSNELTYDLIFTVGTMQNIKDNLFKYICKASSKYVMFKEPIPLSRKSGIFSIHNYEKEMNKFNFELILMKKLPNNTFGITTENSDNKCPVLYLFKKKSK